MKKENKDSWDYLKRMNQDRQEEKGELIGIEDIKVDIEALGRACARFLWDVIVKPVLDDVAKDFVDKEGRVNGEKTST